MEAANVEQAVEHYRSLAPRYDFFTRRINKVRLRTIESLDLRPGDVVVDAGCGTGWCLPAIAGRIGPRGRIVAFDPSPDMLSIARSRPNGPAAPPVDFIHATAEEVVLPVRADAILFSYTHDLIRSPRALSNLLAQARPGARIAATSTKLYAPWLFPANWYLRHTHREYITNFESFDAPWSRLAELLDDFRVETSGWTQHYIATGRVRGA